jgi:hypothetical protein
VQTVAGTYLEPAVTDNVEITDMSITPMESETAELTLIKRTFGANPIIPFGLRVKLSFSIALSGSGVAGTAPYWGALERICGMAQTLVATTSVTYKPADSAFELGSLACYIGVNKHALKDARGTSSIDINKGGFLVRKYEITGIYIDPIAGTIPAVSIAPRLMPSVMLPNNTVFSLHGVAACLKSMSIDTGFDVKFMQYLSCVDTVSLNDRSVKGSVEIVAESIATKDWFSTCKTGETGELSFTLDATAAAGRRLAITAPKVQLTNPQYGDDDGIKTLKMDMILMPSAGSDDYSLVNT